MVTNHNIIHTLPVTAMTVFTGMKAVSLLMRSG